MTVEIHRVERSALISNRRGLHARAAAKLVKLASTFECAVEVTNNGTTVSGRSIMGLMMLAAAHGCSLRLVTEGADAHPAMTAIVTLIEAGFDEID